MGSLIAGSASDVETRGGAGAFAAETGRTGAAQSETFSL